MSSILTCPQCRGELALPEGRVAHLVCPHCQHKLVLLAQTPPDPAEHVPPQQFSIPPLPEAAPQAAARSPQPPGSAVADYRKRMVQQGQRPSMLGQMVGIVGGGMLGMIMGYWLLNYFGGPRYNFLNVALPMVPHTQTARPAPALTPPPHTDPLMAEEEPPPRPRSGTPLPEEAPPPPAALTPAVAAPPALPSYTADQLGEALAAAHAAIGCENCQSTGTVKKLVVTGTTEVNGKKIESKAERTQPCDVCGGKPTTRINAEVYGKLCHLAEVITFLSGEAADSQLTQRGDAAVQVFLRAASDREKQAAVGRLAVLHLQNHQRPLPGVLLAGTVQQSGRAGDYHWTRLLMFGLPEEVTVVYQTPARFKQHDRILLAGAILEDPRRWFPNYAGPESLIVWAGLPVPLPAEK